MFKSLVKSHTVTAQKMPDVNPVFNQRLNFVYLIEVGDCLSGGDSLAETGTALARVEVLALDNSIGLLDNLLTLGQDELDVAGVGHVRVDLSMTLDES